ncbi:GntG family PLP-dependent aldolase [Bythopirellula goksoeyrii]|uniref:L-allo-threonine aldolase n=1 Tax=Bythopirellula goksoeyrii TaxID=1400387 RepID=A0A5B9QC35_9BACT|nr:GntG family PLP-dependent aldolase [Bythopirellula goksoeyrii]QEG35145.1 L-allo-threonine aldolase [Bythopirellula goksoeyrii]
MEIINIRSDTQTLPSAGMLDAILHAQLGDDTYGEDPTVKEFEKLAAEMVGMEAALLVLSGNMGNLTALMAHGNPGDEVILDPDSHIFYYEVGGLANIAGLMPMPVPSHQGMIDPEELAGKIRKPNLHYPECRLLCLENTHNRSGGRVVPLQLHNELCQVAREHGLAVHLDGARIFNAAAAAGVRASDFTENVDSIQVCLTKGLGCPLGSFVAGSKEFIGKVDRARKRLGGGMRQAGVIAAAGIYALQNNVERLREDHQRARRLAEMINGLPGLSVDMETVESNMVYIDHSESGMSTSELTSRLKESGVIVSTRPPHHIRMCTNLHHDDGTIEEVVDRVKKVLCKEEVLA